jgi:uncharacterized membrane protein YqaE (UPF0057 family)
VPLDTTHCACPIIIAQNATEYLFSAYKRVTLYSPRRKIRMGCGRALLCIVFPPLAVLDRGCGTVIIVFALTLAGWIPGAIAALLINYQAVNR